MDYFKVDDYLERINYKGRTDVSEETLHDLHGAHTFNVPFENLDVYFGKQILLDKDSLFKKIVEDKRGGYCFEMNGLFSHVLRELGFTVKDVLARCTRDGGQTYTAKVHEVLVVELNDKKWLVDVGYGNEGIATPLSLETEEDQVQIHSTYRVVHDPKVGYIFQHKLGEEYNTMYAFTLEESSDADIAMSNHFTATHPESFFTKMKMCTMPIEGGRITLTDEHFKKVINGKIEEIKLKDENEYKEYLKKYFKLDMDQVK